MKACNRCGLELPMSEFYKHPTTADGHFSACKVCVREQARNRERHKREHDPEWRASERARYRSKSRPKSRQAADRHKATYWLVHNAKRDGRLVPATVCEDCGHNFSDLDFRREAHHEDYSRPLDVTWLCALCHGKRHRRIT